MAFGEPASPEAGDLPRTRPICMNPKSAAIEHDDFTMQEKDTEVEDFSSTADPLASERRSKLEPRSVTDTVSEEIWCSIFANPSKAPHSRH